jgi:ribonuclease BN (tRNA processing enzyme)
VEDPLRVELLQSSVGASHRSHAEAPQFLVSYLINAAVVIDAGSIGLLADLHRQRQVRHVFITHEHIDHIASLPILLENVYEPGPGCVELLAAEDVLNFLQRDIFNGRVWPDFFDLSTADDAFVTATPLVAGTPVSRAGLTVTPLSVEHSVDTLGMLVDDGTSAVAFPSDTGPMDSYWERLSALPRLDAVFLEVSFPNSHRDLAAHTGHHCPVTFATEIAKLRRPVRWIVVHRKARYADVIATELAALGLPGVEIVEPGREYTF